MSVSIKVLVISVTVLISLYETQAVKCYVCHDCDSSYNSSHLIECKGKHDRCTKMELVNGNIDRGCGDPKKKCLGREASPKRNKRAIIDSRTDELIVGPPKRRTVRQLLQAPSSSNSNSNKNSKKPASEALEVKILYCCADPECNGVPAKHQTIYISIIIFVIVPYFL